MRITADAYFNRVEDVSCKYFVERNIAGIILDIDNTIVVDGKNLIMPSVVDWIEGIGVPVCLLSNGKEERVKGFAESFGFSYIHRAGKPFKKGFIKAAKLLGIEDFSQIAVIGDQLFSDILGGNMLGCHTIKIEPIDKSADPFPVKVKRWLERFVYLFFNQNQPV